MHGKILTIMLTVGLLALPGFVAALEEGPRLALELTVLSASHSGNVNTPVPGPEEKKECAQHLGELLNEGMVIVETSTSGDAAKKVAVAVRFGAIFHLSNASSRNPKAAIIVCEKSRGDLE